MIKLVAFYAMYRLLRPLVTIVVVAMLVALLLSGTHETAHGSHVVGQLRNAARPLQQLLQHTLPKATGP